MKFPLYEINLVVELSALEFADLFGQSWKCYPYIFMYDECILRNRLRDFWKEIVCLHQQAENLRVTNISQALLDNLEGLDLKNIGIPSLNEIKKEFYSDDGILYSYFHQDRSFSEISFYLDYLIERDCYGQQLFYFDCCTQKYPYLLSGSEIKINGQLILYGIPINISLTYIIT